MHPEGTADSPDRPNQGAGLPDPFKVESAARSGPQGRGPDGPAAILATGMAPLVFPETEFGNGTAAGPHAALLGSR